MVPPMKKGSRPLEETSPTVAAAEAEAAPLRPHRHDRTDPVQSNDESSHHNHKNIPSGVQSTITKKKTTKRLLCIRHGISIANEWMNQPGNQWGDANFRDNGIPDAPLSEAGRQHTQTYLHEQFLASPTGNHHNNNHDNNNTHHNVLYQTLQEVELVIVSPLTRCLETYLYGVEPYLTRRRTSTTTTTMVPILAIPLLRERVYTTSDTGRCASILSREFPTVDFSWLPPHTNHDNNNDQDDDGQDHNHNNCCWWYTGKNQTDDNDDSGNDRQESQRGDVEKLDEDEEWRPHGQNQWYGVPGEPEEVFERRMKELDEWIGHRPEHTIMIISHWGVLQHLTNGMQFENAQAKVLVHSFCPVQGTSTIAPL
jgi:broad specificity phosphatase PhoE